MKVAVDIAPSIWGSMEGLDIGSAKLNVSEALFDTKALTKRLNNNIRPCGNRIRLRTRGRFVMTPLQRYVTPRFVVFTVDQQAVFPTR